MQKCIPCYYKIQSYPKRTLYLLDIENKIVLRSHMYTVESVKVQRAYLTCDVIRNSLRLCFDKIWILVADWSMLESALVTWHVSYKITILIVNFLRYEPRLNQYLLENSNCGREFYTFVYLDSLTLWFFNLLFFILSSRIYGIFDSTLHS